MSTGLDKWDRNLAGQRLLPGGATFDWPTAEEVSVAQQMLSENVRSGLERVEAAVGGTRLLVDAAGKIVLPGSAVELIAGICAVAHQGTHGHVPYKQSVELIRAAFEWPGLKDAVQSWVAR